MTAISAFGSEMFLMAVTGLILFVVSFRRGSILFQIILWSFVLTTFFKEWLDLPRPPEIDPAVRELYPELALKFFTPVANPGFPSGHVFSTVAFWGAAILLFRARTVRLAGAALMLLMPFSRMYLGKHFLGDTLGGFALGLFLLIPLMVFLHGKTVERLEKRLLPIYLLVVPCTLNLLPFFDPRDCGQFFGVNAGLLPTILSGVPEDRQRQDKGFTALLLAALCYAGAGYLLFVFGASQSNDPWIRFVTAAIPPALAIGGTLEAEKRLFKNSRDGRKDGYV